MKHLCLTLCLFCCCIVSAQYYSFYTNNDGHYPPDMLQLTRKPVILLKDSKTIKIQFNTSPGAVEIAVYDESGQPVYLVDTNATAGSLLVIDSSFWSGSYTVEVTDSADNVLLSEIIECN